MTREWAGRIAAAAASALLAASLVWSTASQAQQQVIVSAGDRIVAGAPVAEWTVTSGNGLPAVLRACLFAEGDRAPATRTITQAELATDCVVPYINGLWLDPKGLFRGDLAAQARDELIVRPAGAPFPIFYPPQLARQVLDHLREPLAAAADVVTRPLPEVMPPTSMSRDSLYNNIGLLYLPNAYVVPGGTFNEMYGWDTFFIIKGMLASVDYIMRNPTARIWSPSDEAFIQLTDDPHSERYYRAYANRLFRIAKGMVDNHIFQINYYGGFVLNANRTYYLDRSQPPLFTQEALAVFESAQLYGFAYEETLAPFLAATHKGFVAPTTWHDWIKTEVLPAARIYYGYWTDPKRTLFGSASNPRVASVPFDGAQHDIYLYGTEGVGPAPEVAHSTQPENRQLYALAAKYFAENPDRNPERIFYDATNVCPGDRPVNNCSDPVYKLTQTFYRADRAVRASGIDLSDRFGAEGEWTMSFAPLSLNVLLLQMAADIDRLAVLVAEGRPFGTSKLAERRAFLKKFFARPPSGYGDRFIGAKRPEGVPEYAYPFATQFLMLWAGVLDGPRETAGLVVSLGHFLGSDSAGHHGVPSSFTTSGKQWDLPYAWAPFQFFAADGLAASGYSAHAARVMLDWTLAVNAFFSQAGIIIERYHYLDPRRDQLVKIGYSHAQHGFGWSNAVYMLFFNRLYGRL